MSSDLWTLNFINFPFSEDLVPAKLLSENATTAAPTTAHVQADMDGGATVAEKSPSKPRHCTDRVAFSIWHINPTALADFDAAFTTIVHSAQACAAECFRQRCTRAVYHSKGFRGSEFESFPGASCSMSFGTEDDCSNVDRVWNYTGSSAVRVGCVRCGKASLVLYQ